MWINRDEYEGIVKQVKSLTQTLYEEREKRDADPEPKVFLIKQIDGTVDRVETSHIEVPGRSNQPWGSFDSDEYRLFVGKRIVAIYPKSRVLSIVKDDK